MRLVEKRGGGGGGQLVTDQVFSIVDSVDQLLGKNNIKSALPQNYSICFSYLLQCLINNMAFR